MFWQALVLAIPGIVFYALATSLMIGFALRRRREPGQRPPVSVLKPMADTDLDRLGSFVRQNYPDYQVVVGVRTDTEASRIQDAYPGVETVVTGEPDGANPKTSKLARMIERAKHDLIVVTDEDVTADPEFLNRVARAFEDPRVGAATSLCAVRCASFASAFHASVWAIDKIAFLLIARAVGWLRFGNGCATAVRRSVLEQGGGFEAYADRIGDGYWWPNLAWKAGKRVEILDGFLEMEGPASWKTLWPLHVRYVREQRGLEPIGHFLSITTYAWLWALPWPWEVAAALLALRMSHALFVPRVRRWFWLMPIRDVWSILLWVVSYLGRTVQWRGKRYRVGPGGRLTPVSDTTSVRSPVPGPRV